MLGHDPPPTGSSNRGNDVRSPWRRYAPLAELITSLALIASTAVALTVVSIEIARADAVASAIEDSGGRFAVALLFSLIFVTMGGFTAIAAGRTRSNRRD